MIKITIDGPKPLKKVGLKNGEDIILSCSKCGKACCSLKITRPDAKTHDGQPLIWRARATCAYGCTKLSGASDMSFPRTIKGTCHFAGCYKDHPTEQDQIIMTTAIIDIKEEEDSDGKVTTYYTKAINC